MNTHENYVSLEVAKLLKKVGFDWICRKHILDEESFKVCEKCEVNFVTINTNPNIPKYTYSAPTLAVAQKWLREVKGIIIQIEYSNISDRYYVDDYCKLNGYYEESGWYNISKVDENGYNTYEEALEAGIKKYLTILLRE